jgi:hypothetical protein
MIIIFIVLIGISFYISFYIIEIENSVPEDLQPKIVLPDMDIIYVNLPNSGFRILNFTADKFSDEKGYRAYPWGFESMKGLGNTTNLFENGIVKIVGKDKNDAVLFALPDLKLHKPFAIGGYNYTLSFEVKLTDVSGHGVRLVHQWFNTTVPSTSMPFVRNFSAFEIGTSNWHIISYTIKSPKDAIRADPVIELWGNGEVEIRNPKLFYTVLNETKHLT